MKIKGVIYDYHYQAPTEPIQPLVFSQNDLPPVYVVFKYDGDFATCRNAITEALRKRDIQKISMKDGEETYKEYMKSEYNFLKLLGIITVVSLLIALFGIYALIVQSCEQHRKEIAIRKVNGAHVNDILVMFFKQYMLQVVIAAAIAFPIGYVLMKRWLEHYTRQTEISIWLF